jgi:hypothetical protein
MPRTAIPVTNLVANGGVQVPTATAVDPTNGHYVETGGEAGRLIITVNNTFAGTKTITIKAGVNPPAFRKDLGDAVFTMAASDRCVVGPFESARFNQAPGGTDGGTIGGRIFIDIAASTTGSIAALFIPDTV